MTEAVGGATIRDGDSFDPQQFQATLQKAIGSDRDLMAVKLRNADALNNVISALKAFTDRAYLHVNEGKQSISSRFLGVNGKRAENHSTSDDVVAAYSRVSPDADELFQALRAVLLEPALTLSALNALVAISQYAHQDKRVHNRKNLATAVLNGDGDGSSAFGSRVLKHVVKSRVSLVYDVFVSGRSDCIRIALNLLTTAADHHPLFAREIVNRFDLTSKHFTPALCTVANHRCRLPFMGLIVSLINTEDADIIEQLCTEARKALLACLDVTIARLRAELAHGFLLSKMREGERSNADDESNEKRIDKRSQPFRIFPSNVQKRELSGAIRFLNTLENLVNSRTLRHLRRSLTSSPFTNLVAEIATTAMPPLTVVPRNVTQHHVNLRAAAKRLLISLLSTASVSPVHLAAVMSRTPAEQGEPYALKVLVDIIRAHPSVAEAILTSGRLMTLRPELSSRWIGTASVLAFCLQISMAPVGTFLQHNFFKNCFGHESALVRHWGSLIALALTRSVTNDPRALNNSSHYLPALKDIYRSAVEASPSDDVMQKLLTTYHFIHNVTPDDEKMNMVQTALQISDNDFCRAEDAIRLSLMRKPHILVPRLIEKCQLSGIVIQAANSKNTSERSRLWRLSADIIKHIDLFPQGTHFEIDIYLTVLSSVHKDDLVTCAKDFESILHSTSETPYEAFDELHDVQSGRPNPFPRASLLVVRLCSRFCMLRSESAQKSHSNCNSATIKFIEDSLLLIFACDEVISGHVFTSSYLARALPAIFDGDDFPWICTENLTDAAPTRLQVCQHVRSLFEKRSQYVQTPFLSLVKRSAAFREFLMSEKEAHIRSWQVGVHLGLLWSSLLEVSNQYPPYDPKADPGVVLYNGKLNERCVDWCDFGALLLEAKSLYPPNCSIENGFSKLCDQLTSIEFFLEITVILRTTENQRVRRASLRILLDILRERHDDDKYPEICSFARSSIVTSLGNRGDLSFSEINMILDYAIDTLSDMGNVEQNRSELLLFCLDVLHKATFHPLNEVCVRTRCLLRSRSIRSLPSLSLFPSASIKRLAELYDFFPCMARLVDGHFLSMSYEACSQVRFEFLHILDTALSNFERLRESDDLPKWQGFCKKLLKTKQTMSVEVPELGQIVLEEDQFPTFCKLVKEWKLLNVENLNVELNCLLDEYASGREAGSFRLFSWMVLAHICRDGLHGLNFTESIEALQSTINHFASALYKVEMSHEDGFSSLMLTILRAYLQQTHFLAESCVRIGTRFQITGRMLRKLCHTLVHTVCSWMQEDLKFSTMEERNRKRSWDSRAFVLILQCLSSMVLLRMIDECDLENVLLTLKKNYFRYIFKQKSDESEFTAGYMPTSTVMVVCNLLSAAIVYYDNSCSNAELAYVFGSAQALFSLRYVGFSAKASERDVSIRMCQHAIDSFLSGSGALDRFSLIRRGRGFFYQKASEVLQHFDVKSLASARMDVYAWSYQSRGSSPALAQASEGVDLYDRSCSTDSEFLLRLFFAACREALDSPESPVLDLGNIAKDGILTVAITALSVSCEEVRKLGYACLQLFTEVVGPISNISRAAAAGLYQDRRQLSFLLQLLQNSIGNAVVQVLPLFAAWFANALGVALSPSHPSYNQVTLFVLRNATLNISDCVGVVNLLHCGGNTDDVKSARLLALEILEKGVQTAADMVVVRKRKFIESLFFLASSGDISDFTVRTKALTVMEVLVRREPQLRLVRELHDVHGMAGWLACEGLGEGVASNEEFIGKTKLLKSMAKHLTRDVAFLKEASGSLSMLLKRVEGDEGSEGFDKRVAARAIICAESVARVAPMQTPVFVSDFASLWRRSGAQFEKDHRLENVTWQRALFVVLRQTLVGGIDDSIIEAALAERVRLLEGERYARIEGEYPPEVLVTDSFISRVLVSRMERQDWSMWADEAVMDTSLGEVFEEETEEATRPKAWSIVGRQTCGLLARGLERCATVWLTIGGLCAVTAHGKADEQLETLAGKVPARPPDNVSVACARSYSHSVQALQTPLVNSLLKIVEQ